MYYILAAVFLLGILSLVYMWFEAGSLKLKRIRFTKSNKGLKIVHLTDIHINLLRVKTVKIKKIIDKESPDLILMSGDYITRQSDIPKFIRFLNEIKGNNKVCLCFGNHDYEAFLHDKKGGFDRFVKEVEMQGVTILHDDSIVFYKGDVKYNIIGITDYRRGDHNIDKALRNCARDAKLNIAISHNPDVVLDMPRGKIDYLFCGHFHGGQIWMPFDLEFKVLRKEKLCKMGIKRGLHRLNGVDFYISNGIGNVLFPLRFLSRPEITVFHMT
ncbi:MAG TPA: metallophosphoesterase [Pseudobacteroides sp.]|uniref:metallophosphoesterase n=1 Tax=Pseudobacteroides sp. TaxID=1968840 RepID=UPI002F94A21E